MLLDEKPLDRLTIEDVNQLITSGICESPRIDYKREWWGKNDDARREMMRDISALANSYGGYLVLGVETKGGSGSGVLECPTSIVGLERLDYSERIMRSSRDNLDPPCKGIEAVQIEVDDNRIVLIIQVPQSLDAPHMVTFKGLNQFWQRHGTDKQSMSTQEIRDMFMSRLNYQENLLQFAQHRILSRKNLFDEKSKPTLLYIWAAPIVPLLSEIDVQSRGLRALFGDVLLNLPFNRDLYSGPPRPSLDGIEADRGLSKLCQFIGLHRNGFLEFGTEIVMGQIKDSDYIHSFGVSAFMANFADLMTNVLRELEAQGPVAFGCALINVAGYRLFTGGQFRELSEAAWPEDILSLDYRVSYDLAAEKNTILSDISDRLWQAFHFDNCPFYSSGELVTPRG